jgi:hypothetical protein
MTRILRRVRSGRRGGEGGIAEEVALGRRARRFQRSRRTKGNIYPLPEACAAAGSQSRTCAARALIA